MKPSSYILISILLLAAAAALLLLATSERPSLCPLIASIDFDQDGLISLHEALQAIKLHEQGALPEDQLAQVIKAWTENQPLSQRDFCQ